MNPVIAPILFGIVWSLSGWTIPAPIDTTLQLAGSAAPALCLLLLGASLGQFALNEGLRSACLLTVIKNVLHPAAVCLVSRLVFGLDSMAVAVVTLAAALPVGNNVYLFAQRYSAEVPVASVVFHKCCSERRDAMGANARRGSGSIAGLLTRVRNAAVAPISPRPAGVRSNGALARSPAGVDIPDIDPCGSTARSSPFEANLSPRHL